MKMLSNESEIVQEVKDSSWIERVIIDQDGITYEAKVIKEGE